MNTADRFGACVVCHKDMVVDRVVGDKIVRMFDVEHDQTKFNLKDGSIMPVCICKTCKRNTNLDDPLVQESIMSSVIDGWKEETKQLVADDKRPEWTQDKADKYISEYELHEIDCHKGDE